MNVRRYAAIIEPIAPIRTTPYSHARKSGALVHSDTLHAALMSVAALTGSPLLDRLRDAPMSSVFPYWRDIRFYPMPRLTPRREKSPEASLAEDRKRWKSVRLVSERLLADCLRGDPAALDRAEIRGCFALAPADLARRPFPDQLVLWGDLVPGIMVDRHSAATVPFDRRCIRVDTGPRAGGAAWFAVDHDPDDLPEFSTLLETLGCQGLGADRSVGYGAFDVVAISPYDPPEPAADATGIYALALYAPTRAEVDAGALDAPAAYECTVRGGWIHSLGGTEHRKRSIRMCTEGSVLRAVPGIQGRVADLTPQSWGGRHPVYRSGRIFALPCALPQGDRR